MRRIRAAVIAAVFALPGVPTSALVPTDLSVSFDPAALVVPQSGADARMTVVNHGPVAATGVTATLDLVELGDAVTVAATGAGCTLAGHVVTCALGQLEPSRSVTLVPLRLTWGPATGPGPFGAVRAAVTADQPEPTPSDNSVRLPVTVVAPDAIPVGLVSDLGTAGRRVGPGGTLPLYAAVRNRGDLPLTDFRVEVLVPLGATLVERYRDCGYSSRWNTARYFPMQVECHLSRPLQPGETLPLFDPATRASLFHVTFGRNLPGPDKLEGIFLAFPEAPPARPDNPAGPSFAAAVARLPVLAAGAPTTGWPLLHGDQAQTQFWTWTRPNTFDIAVTRPAVVRGAIGDQVHADFSLVNNGPSDSGSLEYVITAPKGTVLLPLNECYTEGHPGTVLPESAALHCTTPDPTPAKFSGLTLPRFITLKIKSAPAGGGRIVVRGTGVGSTESKPANNTVPLVVELTPTGGSTTPPAGGGPTLPITGPSVAWAAGAGAMAVLLGAATLLATRRRRPT